MKEVIKKLLRENLLNERLTNVDSDVDLLYDMFFKEKIDKINETGIVNRDILTLDTTYTDILESPESIKANELNSCVIYVNKNGNSYNPNSGIIMISVNRDAVEYVVDQHGGDLKVAILSLDIQQQNSLRNEFTEERIKGSIHHELAHWIDDTMNNRHIQKVINKARELGSGSLYGVPINSTKTELQAQIHNVKQIYNKHKDKWDTMTFLELIHNSPVLNTISKQLEGDVRKKWVRDLKTRMHREGLLGKNMVNR
jgi:hypothetical protein